MTVAVWLTGKLADEVRVAEEIKRKNQLLLARVFAERTGAPAQRAIVRNVAVTLGET
ncbi:hypothetical protein GGD83_004762 [Rhodoblastus sphagnicola]|uniref:hypothetical protein n=1 Tax=Rhodoblastus sphagnicola TaxID=333368 RepID=UPI001304C305|nr:hypothetical protein [Rhodoblastus sphagnicola]MBB4200933.1 hypothetical protein [Rhodoblastus sphagnicola]